MCLVGANLGCKTNLVRKHVSDEFDDRYILTLGAKVSRKVLTFDVPTAGGRVAVDLTLWDIMSHKGFAGLLKEAYFTGTRGIIAVADMTRRQTLDDLGFWIQGVENVTGPIPVAVIGANGERTGNLEVTEADLARVAHQHSAPCFFESSRSGEPIEAAFRYIAREALRASRRAKTSGSGRTEHAPR